MYLPLPLEVIRSRDPELWKTCDALVDVGGVYDVDKLRFDHHQVLPLKIDAY